MKKSLRNKLAGLVAQDPLVAGHLDPSLLTGRSVQAASKSYDWYSDEVITKEIEAAVKDLCDSMLVKARKANNLLDDSKAKAHKDVKEPLGGIDRASYKAVVKDLVGKYWGDDAMQGHIVDMLVDGKYLV